MRIILNELPMTIKGQVAKQVFAEITDSIKFFSDKPSEFLWEFMPKLKQMNFFSGEYLFHQNDHADEVYFILKGKVKLMYDILEGKVDVPFNTPFNMYVEGSYFGDSDVLGDHENEGRDGTALVDAESNLYVITRKDLMEVLSMKQFKKTIAKEMMTIARERRIHHKNAIEELKLQNQHVSKRLLKKYRQKEN